VKYWTTECQPGVLPKMRLEVATPAPEETTGPPRPRRARQHSLLRKTIAAPRWLVVRAVLVVSTPRAPAISTDVAGPPRSPNAAPTARIRSGSVVGQPAFFNSGTNTQYGGNSPSRRFLLRVELNVQRLAPSTTCFSSTKGREIYWGASQELGSARVLRVSRGCWPSEIPQLPDRPATSQPPHSTHSWRPQPKMPPPAWWSIPEISPNSQ